MTAASKISEGGKWRFEILEEQRRETTDGKQSHSRGAQLFCTRAGIRRIGARRGRRGVRGVVGAGGRSGRR